MAKDRTMPCESYVNKGTCSKGREAEHTGYCQHCDKYRPRAKPVKNNSKRAKLNKIKKQEASKGSY